MDIDVLSRVLQHDNESSSFSPELPYNYVEISREILKCCSTTIHPQVKMLLNDIRTIRLDKIRKVLHYPLYDLIFIFYRSKFLSIYIFHF